MCGCGQHGPGEATELAEGSRSASGPPTWDEIQLPPDHILRHQDLGVADRKVTDAHCHPTDLDLDPAEYDAVKLGGITAMATAVDDQTKVKALGTSRPWRKGQVIPAESSSAEGVKGSKVITCFGYHPWFTHRYTLLPEPPSKEEHYTSLFFTPKSDPSSKNRILLRTLLPYLPDPIPFGPLLEQMRQDLSQSLDRGNLTMVGEIGLDAQARMRWPVAPAARALHKEYIRSKGKGREQEQDDGGAAADREEDDGEEWKRLTPFKTDMKHQRRIVEMQMELAVEFGVNVSFHCVAAPGPTLDIFTSFRDRHRSRFTNRVNIDLHSAGGWAPDFWKGAERQLLNLYASPSVLITGRVQHANELIQAISADRMLVESDSHDARMMSTWVWGAVTWIAEVKGWKLEGRDSDPEEEWELRPDDEDDGQWGSEGRREIRQGQAEKERFTVRTIERNWASFMRLID